MGCAAGKEWIHAGEEFALYIKEQLNELLETVGYYLIIGQWVQQIMWFVIHDALSIFAFCFATKRNYSLKKKQLTFICPGISKVIANCK